MLDQSGILAIDNTDGNLKIFLQGRNPIAVSSVKGARNTSATLLQSGNLVLHEINSDGSAKQLLWQSFDYPTDTLLPGMKLGINLQTGHKWFLQSWIGDNSPAQGSFTLGMDNNITNKLIIRWRGEVQRTSAVWLDGHFNLSRPWPADYYKFNFTSNEQEIYFNFSVIVGDAKPFSILKINSDGELTDERGALISCPVFGVCGDDQKLPTCRRGDRIFLSGFNTSENGFKFKESDNLTSADCQAKCLKNCSCVAFAVATGDNTTDCVIWSRGTKFYHPDKFSYTRYLYVIHETNENKIRRPWLVIAIVGALLLLFCCLSYLARRKCKAKEEKWRLSLIIAVGVALLIPLLCYLCYLIWRKLKAEVQRIMNKRKLLRELGDNVSSPNTGGLGKTQEKDQSMNRELKIFNFQTIVSATNNFSAENKLGEGGFGPVYKGELLDGQEIAIKRLSRRSGQGIVEFKNETKLIAKLQHTNLVRLLGCSLKGEERILVYEYMHNKSLDFFIFGRPLYI